MKGSFVVGGTDGLRIEILQYGAIIRALSFPDSRGEPGDLVLGFDTVDEYKANSAPYFGAVVGRYANRIACGQFMLDNQQFDLSKNEGLNHLHGGIAGFDKKVWDVVDASDNSLKLSLVSRDGDEGYPGEVRASVQYEVIGEKALSVEYRATTTNPTPLNLTQHSYFNLSGLRVNHILDHELTVHADKFTEVSEDLIPTGRLLTVEGTGFDFRASRRIGDSHDLDHNFVLGDNADGSLREAAVLFDAGSGRELRIETTEPGLQVYTGNFLDGSLTGKGGCVYGKHAGMALETQHFPDSPNQPHFPSAVLTPDREYISATVFHFKAH